MIIPFQKKPNTTESINKGLHFLCITLNLICIAVSLFSLGYVFGSC